MASGVTNMEKVKGAFEKFCELTRKLVAVPKDELEKRESEYKMRRNELKERSPRRKQFLGR